MLARALIRELGQHHTILLSTHILPEVEMTCDRVIVISRGRLAADGLLEEMKDRDEPLEELYLRIVEGEALRA